MDGSPRRIAYKRQHRPFRILPDSRAAGARAGAVADAVGDDGSARGASFEGFGDEGFGGGEGGDVSGGSGMGLASDSGAGRGSGLEMASGAGRGLARMGRRRVRRARRRRVVCMVGFGDWGCLSR